MIEQITNNSVLVAIIIRSQFKDDGITFFTEPLLSQQLAFMKHPSGKIIQAHIHQLHTRQVEYTQEVLVIRRGRLRVDFYATDRSYIGSKILTSGDVVLLATGGHGFEVLEDLEMFEIKQGPFVGVEDKIRFEGITHDQVRVIQHQESGNVTNCTAQQKCISSHASTGK